MAIALAEADKYEILEKIGKSILESSHVAVPLALTMDTGSGSFGIIRKVMRKSDGFVSCLDFGSTWDFEH